MVKRLVVCGLIAAAIICVQCKKKPPTRDETRQALRGGVQSADTSVVNNPGIDVFRYGSGPLGQIPLFYSGKSANMLGVLTGGREAVVKFVLGRLNGSGPWDTLAGRWLWDSTSYTWNHTANTPTDSMIYVWTFLDSVFAPHSAGLTVTNWNWIMVGGENALTKVWADLQSDNVSRVVLDIKTVEYGSTNTDVRRVEATFAASGIGVSVNGTYTPPNINAALRLDLTRTNQWYELSARAHDDTPPLGGTMIFKAGTYSDGRGWRVEVDCQDPDTDDVQLVSGEISKSGAVGATIKSQKIYENGWPELKVWLEYADGTTEPAESLLAYVGDSLGYGGKKR